MESLNESTRQSLVKALKSQFAVLM